MAGVLEPDEFLGSFQNCHHGGMLGHFPNWSTVAEGYRLFRSTRPAREGFSVKETSLSYHPRATLESCSHHLMWDQRPSQL